MNIAIIHTEIRQITLGGQESVEKAIKNLQDAVYTLSNQMVDAGSWCWKPTIIKNFIPGNINLHSARI